MLYKSVVFVVFVASVGLFQFYVVQIRADTLSRGVSVPVNQDISYRYIYRTPPRLTRQGPLTSKIKWVGEADKADTLSRGVSVPVNQVKLPNWKV